MEILENQDQASAPLDLLEHPAERVEAFEQRHVTGRRAVLERVVLFRPETTQGWDHLDYRAPTWLDESPRFVLTDGSNVIGECFYEWPIGHGKMLVAAADHHNGDLSTPWRKPLGTARIGQDRLALVVGLNGLDYFDFDTLQSRTILELDQEEDGVPLSASYGNEGWVLVLSPSAHRLPRPGRKRDGHAKQPLPRPKHQRTPSGSAQ